MRIAVIGNSGGGKSVLARRIAAELHLPCNEVDTILWRPGWQPTPVDVYDREHAEVDRDWLPEIRWLVDAAQIGGKRVVRLTALADLSSFLSSALGRG